MCDNIDSTIMIDSPASNSEVDLYILLDNFVKSDANKSAKKIARKFKIELLQMSICDLKLVAKLITNATIHDLEIFLIYNIEHLNTDLVKLILQTKRISITSK